MIELVGLTKKYATKNGPLTALEDIDLRIEDGSIFGIIGLSGAGKSTLVRCINLLETPTAGKVFLDGEDLTSLKKKRLLEVRRNVGMIFQNFNLLEQRTVWANVRFPLEIAHVPRKEADSRVKELLGLVGLEDRGDAYPSQLSGGQKQRVAIARALATRPKYLLCDEATSALDPTTTHAILDLLRSVNETLGVTVIVITHEMKVVEQICTDVAVLDNSRIAEQGKVRDVFAFPKSEIARRLVFPDLPVSGENQLRLVFNGTLSDAPVIAGLALQCGVAANVAFADTKTVDGKTFGHMLVSFEDGKAREKAKAYFNAVGVQYEEEVCSL